MRTRRTLRADLISLPPWRDSIAPDAPGAPSAAVAVNHAHLLAFSLSCSVKEFWGRVCAGQPSQPPGNLFGQRKFRKTTHYASQPPPCRRQGLHPRRFLACHLAKRRRVAPWQNAISRAGLMTCPAECVMAGRDKSSIGRR